MCHFTFDKINYFNNNLLEERIACDLPGMEVSPRELGIIVEHFLEMRNSPKIVGTVTREAAADRIVHSAARHGF